MYRDTWMEVNIDAIKKNTAWLKQHSGKNIIAVLKANAYGCGDKMIAQATKEAGAMMFAVSSLDEALMLRKKGFNDPILILGAVNPNSIDVLIQYNISTAAFSKEWIDEVCKQNAKGLKVHLAVDTGMNRIGLKDLESCQLALQQLIDAGCDIEGIFTHFCCSDDKDHVMTNLQYKRFADIVHGLNYPFPYVHCDNSDATIFFKDDLSNACRIGLAIYGYSDYAELDKAISLYTTVVMEKVVRKGEKVGYGATYTVDHDCIIATLPIGYADGFIRANQGRKVYIDGQYVSVVGRICMDQTMILLDHEVPLYSKVEIFGKHIPLEQMAEELHTIPYEIMCLLTDRVTRKYVGEHIDTERNERLLESSHDCD